MVSNQKECLNLTIIATVGGEGTRLYPLTLTRPKPLLNICGEAVMTRMFESLAYQGCREFILATKGSDITTRLKDFFKDGAGFSTRLDLKPPAVFRYQSNYEDKGSGDAVRHNIEFFDIKKDILVISGDTIIEISVDELLNYHRAKKALLTVGLKKIEGADLSQFGVAEIGEDFRIKKFVEKPKPGTAPSNLVNTAVYLFSPEIKNVFREMGDKVRDLGGDILPFLTENNYPVYGYEIKGYWTDVGTPGSFLDATHAILQRKLPHFAVGESIIKERGLWIHRSTWKKIEKDVNENRIHIREPVKIGADCRIYGATIENSFIGDTVVIEEGTTIRNSIVMDFSHIGKNVRLNNCIVGEYSTIENNSVIDSTLPVEVIGGTPDLVPVVGSNVKISGNSVLGPKKRVSRLKDSHTILATKRFKELGYDANNVYFIEI